MCVVSVEIEIMSIVGGVVWQVLVYNFQFFVIFFEIDVVQVRCCWMCIVVNFFIGFFGMFDYYFLIVNIYLVKLFEIVFLMLYEYIIVVGIYVIFDYCYFMMCFFVCWVFCFVDKVVQIVFFYLMEVVNFFFYVDIVVEGFYCCLGNRKIYIVVQGKDMDQYVILCGWCQFFIIRNKIFQFFCFDVVIQDMSGIVVKCYNGFKMGVWKFDFEGCQFIGKCFVGCVQGVQVVFYIGFNLNCCMVMFW